MESFKAYVEKIIYRNEDNGYTVLSAEENGCETVCVGVFQFIDEGEYLEFFLSLKRPGGANFSFTVLDDNKSLYLSFEWT